MASLTDSFSLVTLPRIADINLSQKAVVANTKSTNQQILDIGLSRSAICSYILKPTPKLIWTYALSPTTIVDCIDVAVNRDGVKQFATGLTERKKGYKLMYLQQQPQQQTADDGATQEAEEEQQVVTRTIQTKSKVVSTHFNKDASHVYVILDDCTVEVYRYPFSATTTTINEESNEDANEEEEDNSEFNTPIYSNLNKLRNAQTIYHQYIESGANDGVLLLVELINKKKVQVRLLSLDLTNTIEIQSVVLEEDYTPGSSFTYDPLKSTLYEFTPSTKSLKLYTLPTFTLVKTISFAERFEGEVEETKKNAQEAAVVSMTSPAPERLLITFNGIIYLVNTKYEAVLDEIDLRDDANKISLQSVVRVKGSSLKTSQSFAVYLSHNTRANASELNIINVNVGLGTLSECLGKGIKNKTAAAAGAASAASNTPSNFSGLANLLDEKFVEDSNALTREMEEIYSELKNAAEEENLRKWERIVIPYLKGEPWEKIKKSLKKIKGGASGAAASDIVMNGNGNGHVSKQKDYDFKVFEVEKDRTIDYNFIYSITSLIFTVDEGSVQFKSSFNPEHSLTYLFTHPLYPKEFTNGLLSLFANRAETIAEPASSIGSLRLLRQALITCPNLSCLEITKQLNNANDEIFQDVVTRLIEEYSINQITSTLLEVLKQTSDFNLEECIKKCFILDNGWEIVPAIVDAGGLFGWSRKLIDKVIEDVEAQLEALTLNSYNLTLTSQAILVNSSIANGSNAQAQKKKSKKKSKKERKQQGAEQQGQQQQQQSNNESIVESNKQQEQLDSILTINNNSRKNLLDDGISISKKVPVYSVERLIL